MRNPRILGREFVLDGKSGMHYLVWCPGCEMLHRFTTSSPDGGPTWDFDGNLESPTFSPSLLCFYVTHLCAAEHGPVVCPNPRSCGQTAHLILNPDWRQTDKRVLGHNTPHTRDPAWGNCHSFLRAGRWQFLADSAHKLAGQTVDMVPLPDWACGSETP